MDIHIKHMGHTIVVGDIVSYEDNTYLVLNREDHVIWDWARNNLAMDAIVVVLLTGYSAGRITWFRNSGVPTYEGRLEICH